MDYVEKVFNEVTQTNLDLYKYAAEHTPFDAKLNELVLCNIESTKRIMMRLKPFLEYQAPLDIEKLDSQQLKLFYN